MANQKTTTAVKTPPLKAQQTTPSQPFLFTRENYMIMAAGILLLAIGFMLMTGGSQSPDQFDPEVVYSFRRITLSTIVVMLGFAVVLVSIFWKRRAA